jgi:hypothetical protein
VVGRCFAALRVNAVRRRVAQQLFALMQARCTSLRTRALFWSWLRCSHARSTLRVRSTAVTSRRRALQLESLWHTWRARFLRCRADRAAMTAVVQRVRNVALSRAWQQWQTFVARRRFRCDAAARIMWRWRNLSVSKAFMLWRERTRMSHKALALLTRVCLLPVVCALGSLGPHWLFLSLFSSWYSEPIPPRRACCTLGWPVCSAASTCGPGQGGSVVRSTGGVLLRAGLCGAQRTWLWLAR